MKAKLVNESFNKQVLYRNTSIKWIKEFKENGIIHGNPFISFSLDPGSGSMDNFGEDQIIFDAEKVFDQGAIEILYEKEFFEQYPDICYYVTGYSSEQDYYDNQDEFDNAGEADALFELSWEDTINDFEHEEEVVIKTLRNEEGLIL